MTLVCMTGLGWEFGFPMEQIDFPSVVAASSLPVGTWGLRVQLEHSPFLNILSDQKVSEQLQMITELDSQFVEYEQTQNASWKQQNGCRDEPKRVSVGAPGRET